MKLRIIARLYLWSVTSYLNVQITNVLLLKGLSLGTDEHVVKCIYFTTTWWLYIDFRRGSSHMFNVYSVSFVLLLLSHVRVHLSPEGTWRWIYAVLTLYWRRDQDPNHTYRQLDAVCPLGASSELALSFHMEQSSILHTEAYCLDMWTQRWF